MSVPADSFYDDLASSYHLIFDDWEQAIDRQRVVLTRLLPAPETAGRVLDCACGIGTQALGLARAGYAVEGADLSAAEVARAGREAEKRQLDIPFRVDDMRRLSSCEAGRYGAVIAFDNAIPHLDSDEELAQAFAAMRRSLQPDGQLLLSVRDYGPLMAQRPAITPPSLFLDNGLRRIVHQLWDWHDDRRYSVHLYITRETSVGSWQSSHFVGRYRAITLDEITAHVASAGFDDVRILAPDSTGYYQPIITARAQRISTSMKATS